MYVLLLLVPPKGHYTHTYVCGIPGRELLLGKCSLASKTTRYLFFSPSLILLDSEGTVHVCMSRHDILYIYILS